MQVLNKDEIIVALGKQAGIVYSMEELVDAA